MQDVQTVEDDTQNKGIFLLQSEISNTAGCYKSNLEITQKTFSISGRIADDNVSSLSLPTDEIFQNHIDSPISLETQLPDVHIPIDLNKTENSSINSAKSNDVDGIKEFLPNNEKPHADGDVYKARLFQTMDIDEGCNSINARRLVTKEGIVDIKYVNMPGIKSRFLRDLFHTLMDAKWRYNCLLFTLSFIISWVFFGTIWYIIYYIRKNKTCVADVDSWVTAFLFSIETQTTIGYGGRAVTDECPEGVILLAVQTIIGMFIQCFMLGLMFGKLARPKNRGKTTMFSKNAVVTVRDGQMCLVFRYADLCRRILLDSNMRMVIIRPRLTEEGEYLPLDMADLELTIDYEQVEYTMRLFPLFPVTVIHVIDENSPLYKMSKLNLSNAEFEIIAILEGTVPTTGNTTQALTSYRPKEILWGHRFKPVCLGVGHEMRMNSIDLMTIHDTYEEEVTPDCSAEQYENDSSSSSSSISDYAEKPNADIEDFKADLKDDTVSIDNDRILDLPQLKETEA